MACRFEVELAEGVCGGIVLALKGESKHEL
jgi:hypothetical protein